MSADLAALTLCRCGQIQTGTAIYKKLSLPLPNVDPAFTLELLTGAYLEQSQFEKAERMSTKIRVTLLFAILGVVLAVIALGGLHLMRTGRLLPARVSMRRE